MLCQLTVEKLIGCINSGREGLPGSDQRIKSVKPYQARYAGMMGFYSRALVGSAAHDVIPGARCSVPDRVEDGAEVVVASVTNDGLSPDGENC